MIGPRRRLWIVAVVAALLAACAPRIVAPPEPEKGALAVFPDGYYRQLQTEGKAVFRVDPARSLVVIEVRRGGSFAQLGHDHVVASHDVAGAIAPDEGRADFSVPLDNLVVDEPALRKRAGFDTQPDAGDIAGTRHNMLTKVLDSQRYPLALIAVNGFGDGDGETRVRSAMTLHGTTRDVEAVARMDKSADGLTVTGTLAIDQSAFGITPFSILNGAVAVQDRVNITFDLRFRRAE